mmetsp:Transcript_6536/g.18048  ORF Transcript_6536/g.18048 Transcript_6536/m.18048 type:complete len:200 (-) Transcript_6536:651-1250(-)
MARRASTRARPTGGSRRRWCASGPTTAPTTWTSKLRCSRRTSSGSEKARRSSTIARPATLGSQRGCSGAARRWGSSIWTARTARRSREYGLPRTAPAVEAEGSEAAPRPPEDTEAAAGGSRLCPSRASMAMATSAAPTRACGSRSWTSCTRPSGRTTRRRSGSAWSRSPPSRPSRARKTSPRRATSCGPWRRGLRHRRS